MNASQWSQAMRGHLLGEPDFGGEGAVTCSALGGAGAAAEGRPGIRTYPHVRVEW